MRLILAPRPPLWRGACSTCLRVTGWADATINSRQPTVPLSTRILDIAHFPFVIAIYFSLCVSIIHGIRKPGQAGGAISFWTASPVLDAPLIRRDQLDSRLSESDIARLAD